MSLKQLTILLSWNKSFRYFIQNIKWYFILWTLWQAWWSSYI